MFKQKSTFAQGKNSIPHLKELQGMQSVLQGMTEGTGASFTD